MKSNSGGCELLGLADGYRTGFCLAGNFLFEGRMPVCHRKQVKSSQFDAENPLEYEEIEWDANR